MSKLMDELNRITVKEIYPQLINDVFFPLPVTTPKIDAINVVIEREMLPSLVYDNPRAQLFTDWKFSGLTLDYAPLARATVSATYIPTGGQVSCAVVINADNITHMKDPNALFTHLDTVINNAVESIITNAIETHVDGVLCARVNCEECYS